MHTHTYVHRYVRTYMFVCVCLWSTILWKLLRKLKQSKLMAGKNDHKAFTIHKKHDSFNSYTVVMYIWKYMMLEDILREIGTHKVT